jgi:hypothetical protein
VREGDVADLVEALELARAERKAAWHGIGEPAIRLDPKHILVNSERPLEIHMRMDDLIQTVRRVLERP